MIESEARTDLVMTETAEVSSPLKLALVGRMSRPVAVALFAALTALGAMASVPLGFSPVPMSLQTLAVLLSGLLLGPFAGATSQLLYLGLGVIGLPIFALGGGGLPWVFGPTGGFLMAFPVAAALAGWIAGSERTLGRTALGILVGTLAVFALGSSWMATITDWEMQRVFLMAVQPFLLGAVIKGGIALVITRLFFTKGLGR